MTRIGLPLVAVIALAGCGSSNSTTSSSTPSPTKTATTASTATSGSLDKSVAAIVPDAIKTKGTLNVATEAQYAPNEFVAPDGHTIIGMDPDLVKALATTMGLKAQMINANFETIIPGLASGRYDMGASSFTDTKEREKTVDFVTYFNAGISFYAKSSTNPGVTTVKDLCGKSAAVEKGTVEQEAAEEQNKTCTKEGKKGVDVLVYTGQNAVNLAVSSGRAEVGMADSPVVAYQIKVSNGTFKLIGKSYGFEPYGLALPKTTGMSQPVLEAMKEIIANGTYHAILVKWGLTEGAISEPQINGAKS